MRLVDLADGGLCRSVTTRRVQAHVENTEVDIMEVHRLGRNAVSPLMSQARRNGEGMDYENFEEVQHFDFLLRGQQMCLSFMGRHV